MAKSFKFGDAVPTTHSALYEKQATSALLGAAVGDAFGVTFEFLPSHTVAQYDLENMHGADVEPDVPSYWGLRIPSGAWSDDTSMAVATMESIVENGGEINPTSLMKYFVSWWEDGAYCSIDYPFGIGQAVAKALGKFENGIPAEECGGTRVRDNGNGALMRIFPVVLYLRDELSGEPEQKVRAYETICAATRITHAHPISQVSNLIYAEFLNSVLDGATIPDAYRQTVASCSSDLGGFIEENGWEDALHAHARILATDFLAIDRSLLEPTGYVVHTFEIVLYALLHSSSYKEAVQTAVSFGGDTDTYAAIAGAVAGVAHGAESIPAEWLERLKRRDYLESLAFRFGGI